MGNCPNCGAPITGPECEYCGTKHRGYRREVPGLMEDACSDFEIAKAKIQLLSDQNAVKRLYWEAIQAMRRYTE